MLRSINTYIVFILGFTIISCAPPPHFDILIKNGAVLDGTGGEAQMLNIGIVDDQFHN